MFDHIEAGWSASGDSDQAFLASVKNASTYVDKGIHIGSWGQLQGGFINSLISILSYESFVC
jgi:alpha-L-fucosidase 2